MKNLFFLSILIFTFFTYGLAQGLTKAISNMQSETSEKVKQMLMQTDSERNSGAKTSSKNYAKFTPSASENLKNIANEMGKTAEEKAMFLQLFTETKKGFESEAADKKNNVAGAMTFLMATAVMVYHESPEPSDAATKKLFNGLNSMFDEMPEMGTASSKDKQFLYDLYISYGGLILASYQEAVGTKNRETIDAIRVLAGSTLLDVFKINPTTIYFEGDSLRMKSESGGNSENRQTQLSQPTSKSHSFVHQISNFGAEGWISTPMEDYVSVQGKGVEVRLYYDNKQLADSIPNTVSKYDFYWDKTVSPYFNTGEIEKTSGDSTLFEKLMQADATDKQTGKRCFVSEWYAGFGLKKGFMIIIAPNRDTYRKVFPNTDALYKMWDYNKFGVAAQDIVGNWKGGNGYYAEYYSVYTGNYAGMSASNTADDMVFRADGSYQHIYSSANTVNGSTKFDSLTFKGKFTVVSPWEITATNHWDGITANFASQIKAVKGGYLLVLHDTRRNISYTVFKKQ